jgi:hypothetical protein
VYQWNGLSLQVSYTWEKNLTDADAAIAGFSSAIQNPANLHQDKPVAVEDLPHTLVVAPLYQLPFGKGRVHLNHRAASYVAGGWEVGTLN